MTLLKTHEEGNHKVAMRFARPQTDENARDRSGSLSRLGEGWGEGDSTTPLPSPYAPLLVLVADR